MPEVESLRLKVESGIKSRQVKTLNSQLSTLNSQLILRTGRVQPHRAMVSVKAKFQSKLTKNHRPVNLTAAGMKRFIPAIFVSGPNEPLPLTLSLKPG
jgi:hypothetical protein